MNINKIISELPKVYNEWGKPNQFVIKGKDFSLFQSYFSPIAMHSNGKTYIFRDWDYSRTTGKYRNSFLGESKKETYKKLKSGEYIAIGFKVV